MNEITKIHLGRQPFVIAVDAHKLLQEYLHDIKRQVGKNGEGVVDEVEVRMAELLGERGISGEKVVLAEDVAYLKGQLGSPSDFKDDDDTDEASSKSDDQPDATRRLFRDTENGMLAGVSSGVANYFGIDPVIIRILFVIATVSGGWGIAVYIVMWLVMPEAKTASERLQMRGKAVTVDSLKEIVDRADVSGAAQRATHSLGPILGAIVRIILLLVGCVLTTVAVTLLVAVAIVGVYALLHNGHLVHGAFLFPVGVTETVAAIGGLGVFASIFAFLLMSGVAMARRKWSVPGWGVAALCGVLLASAIAAGAAIPDTVQNLRSRYEAASHTETRALQPFTKVQVQQGDDQIDIDYEYDGPYKAEVRYLGNVDTRDIKTTVQDGTLTVDTRDFKPGANWDCDGLCVGNQDYFRIVIHEPQTAEPLQQVPPVQPQGVSPVKPL